MDILDDVLNAIPAKEEKKEAPAIITERAEDKRDDMGHDYGDRWMQEYGKRK